MGTIRALMSVPNAASDNACRNRVHSTSVTAVDGISEMPFLAHSNALTLYARVNANSAYATVSNLELGRAPVNEASKILAMHGPRGTITLSLMDTYCLSI